MTLILPITVRIDVEDLLRRVQLGRDGLRIVSVLCVVDSLILACVDDLFELQEQS